ncbi:hypothetical protein PoB_007281300 [Plakobranchus ocellatus]|uniref:Uncharacterized protein n=1 Tax=Plakobranchus ocellatus TaxID=259542 RepID=A0AAV4DPP7_9GAST|nr:hypothetical protein PoB_007281300 [Plakobranchus ocellatus]
MAPRFPLSNRATDVSPGCKTQKIAPTLRQVADLVCARTKEREYFKTCICWICEQLPLVWAYAKSNTQKIAPIPSTRRESQLTVYAFAPNKLHVERDSKHVGSFEVGHPKCCSHFTSTLKSGIHMKSRGQLELSKTVYSKNPASILLNAYNL